MNKPREIPDPVFAESDHNLGTDLDKQQSSHDEDDERSDQDRED